MNLIRLLLLEFEGEEPKPDMSSYTEEQRVYHSNLLIEAGYAYGLSIPDASGEIVSVSILRLTWDGHEFLDAARNETIWNKVMTKIKGHAMTVTIGILTEMLKYQIRETLHIQL